MLHSVIFLTVKKLTNNSSSRNNEGLTLTNMEGLKSSSSVGHCCCRTLLVYRQYHMYAISCDRQSAADR